MSDHYRQPPDPVRGLEYEMVEEAQICMGGCAEVVPAGEWVIKRNRRGPYFRNYLPANNGICLSCAGDRLSEYSLVAYEKVLVDIDNYETLKENQAPTDADEELADALELEIKAINNFIDELGNFVRKAEDEPPEYLDVGDDAGNDAGNEPITGTDSTSPGDGGEGESLLSQCSDWLESEQSEDRGKPFEEG